MDTSHIGHLDTLFSHFLHCEQRKLVHIREMFWVVDSLCCAIQCSAMQCSAVLCIAMQSSTVQYSAILCSAVQCSAVSCFKRFQMINIISELNYNQ